MFGRWRLRVIAAVVVVAILAAMISSFNIARGMRENGIQRERAATHDQRAKGGSNLRQSRSKK